MPSLAMLFDLSAPTAFGVPLATVLIIWLLFRIAANTEPGKQAFQALC